MEACKNFFYSSEWRQYRGRAGWGAVRAVGADALEACKNFLCAALSGGSRGMRGGGVGGEGGVGGDGGVRGEGGGGGVGAEGALEACKNFLYLQQ